MDYSEILKQFPLIMLILALFSITFSAIGITLRWVWVEFKKTRAEEQAWREKQNTLRDQAWSDQNRFWREALVERDNVLARLDKERCNREDLVERQRHDDFMLVAQTLRECVVLLRDHDIQAKAIMMMVTHIDERLGKGQ